MVTSNTAVTTATPTAAALAAAETSKPTATTNPADKVKALVLSDMEKAAKKKAETAAKRQAAEPQAIKRTLEETLKDLAAKQELNKKRSALIDAIDKVQSSLETLDNEFESKSLKLVFRDAERSYNDVSISNSELIKAFCKMLISTAKNRIKELEAELMK